MSALVPAGGESRVEADGCCPLSLLLLPCGTAVLWCVSWEGGGQPLCLAKAELRSVEHVDRTSAAIAAAVGVEDKGSFLHDSNTSHLLQGV